MSVSRAWERMVVFAFISDNKHGRILQKPLHMLPSRATPHAAALVIAPAPHNRTPTTPLIQLHVDSPVPRKWAGSMDFAKLSSNFYCNNLNGFAAAVTVWYSFHGILLVSQQELHHIICLSAIVNSAPVREELERKDLDLGCGEPLIGFWPYLRHE